MSDSTISPVGPGTSAGLGSAAPASPQGPGFGQRLFEALRSADQEHRAAEARSTELAAGEGDVIETMVALSKADLSLRLAVNLRNRALEAYQTIMRLPL